MSICAVLKAQHCPAPQKQACQPTNQLPTSLYFSWHSQFFVFKPKNALPFNDNRLSKGCTSWNSLCCPAPGGCCTSGASTTWRPLLPSAMLGWTEKWGPKMMPKITCYFLRFFFRWWTVKMSSRQPVPLITTSISWAGVKHLKLTRAKPELSCQLGVKGKIVPCHLKSSFDSNQTNLSETEQNNSINFIILSRTTDQWTIREADVSHKHYHMFLTSIGEG